jgi:hypothetical protein
MDRPLRWHRDVRRDPGRACSVGLAYAGALLGFRAMRQPGGLWLAQE